MWLYNACTSVWKLQNSKHFNLHTEWQTVKTLIRLLGVVWSGSTLFVQAYLSKNFGSLRYILISKVSNYCNPSEADTDKEGLGKVARSEACSLGMQAALSLIPTSGTFFRGGLVMKTFLRPFSLFRWFKKSSCQLLVKECALSTGKLPRRLAQEQCG